ncbi:MAG: hypothetical protein ABSG69_06665 [Candidatus Acidiferrum sp.]
MRRSSNAQRTLFPRNSIRRLPAAWGPVFDALAKARGLMMKMEEGFAVLREFARTLET